MKKLIIALSAVLYSTCWIQTVEARHLRDETLRDVSRDICIYAEANLNTTPEDFSTHIRGEVLYREGDIEDIRVLLDLLKRNCSLDLVQNSVSYLSRNNRLQDLMVDYRIRELCGEAKNTPMKEAQAFQDSVSNVRNSLGLAMVQIPKFYDQLKENCEKAKQLLTQASKEDRREARERLKKYGYKEGMTYSEFRKVLINRGWKPVSNSSAPYLDYAEIHCGNHFCGADFISNQKELDLEVRVVKQNGNSEKIIPEDLNIHSK